MPAQISCSLCCWIFCLLHVDLQILLYCEYELYTGSISLVLCKFVLWSNLSIFFNMVKYSFAFPIPSHDCIFFLNFYSILFCFCIQIHNVPELIFVYVVKQRLNYLFFSSYTTLLFTHQLLKSPRDLQCQLFS